MGSGMVVTMVSSLRIKTRFVVVRSESKNLPEMDNDSLQLCNSGFKLLEYEAVRKVILSSRGQYNYCAPLLVILYL